MLDNTGIYKIQNSITGDFYIGSSVDIKQRFYVHQSMLRRNQHHGKYLQRAYNKYGKEKFEFKIILLCEKFELLRYEQLLLDTLFPKYNSFKLVDRPSVLDGRKHSEETKRKIGLGNKNKVILESQRQAIGDANRKRVVSAETREKMRVAKLGDRNPFFGKTHSDEVKALIVKLNKSRKRKKVENV